MTATKGDNVTVERFTYSIADGRVEGRTLKGTAHLYGMTTVDGRNHCFAPGVFAASIAAGKVQSFAHHDPTKWLGGQDSGSLRLLDGPKALQFELDLPAGVSYAEDLRALQAAGRQLSMSFGFAPGKYERVGETKVFVSGELLSVDPVVRPAFAGTSVILNSAGGPQTESAHATAVRIRGRVRGGRRDLVRRR